MKLNLCSGPVKLPGFINIDSNKEVEPDLVLDILTEEFPYELNSVDEIWLIHGLEHIPYKDWYKLFFKMWNLLKEDGEVTLIHPEFEVCAKYFLENKRGNRDFWRIALYGEQRWPGDFHVVPVVTTHLIQALSLMGFKDFRKGPEAPGQEYATCLNFKKGVRLSRSDAFKIDMFEETPA